jgi:hypothetical protein
MIYIKSAKLFSIFLKVRIPINRKKIITAKEISIPFQFSGIRSSKKTPAKTIDHSSHWVEVIKQPEIPGIIEEALSEVNATGEIYKPI